MKRLLPLLASVLVSIGLSSQAVITAVFDADLPGGLPKGVELYLLDDIADLSMLGIGSANNGGGTDGVEFTFPAMPVDSGTYVYVSSDSAGFRDFFGFNSDFVTGAMAINGDDAIELFWDSVSIDVFGDINQSGAGQPWEYTDGWAARNPFTGPDGSTFVLQNWTFSGPNALDGETMNGTAVNPVPIQSYTDTTSTGPDVFIILQNLQFIPADVTIEKGQTVRWTNVENTVAHNVNGLQDLYPCNPTGFFSGVATVGPWDFDFTFNAPGVYAYQCDPHLSSGMIGTLTVVDPDAPNYPFYDIATVHTEDMAGVADSLGVRCKIRGVVHGPNYRPSGLQFTIIDVAAGVGMNVFKSGADCYEVSEGDMLEVQGQITQFNGLTEILSEGQISVLSSGNTLMTPQEVTDPLTEDMESTMVRVGGLQVDSVVSTGASGWNLFGTNGAMHGFVIRLDADVIADGNVYSGQVVDVTGIVGQFDTESPYSDGYQVFPRADTDIEIQVSTIELPRDAIIMMPNPVSSRVVFRTEEQIQQIEVFQGNGQNILLQTGSQYTIDVSAFPAGQFFIRIVTENGVWCSPFVKI